MRLLPWGWSSGQGVCLAGSWPKFDPRHPICPHLHAPPHHPAPPGVTSERVRCDPQKPRERKSIFLTFRFWAKDRMLTWKPKTWLGKKGIQIFIMFCFYKMKHYIVLAYYWKFWVPRGFTEKMWNPKAVGRLQSLLRMRNCGDVTRQRETDLGPQLWDSLLWESDLEVRTASEGAWCHSTRWHLQWVRVILWIKLGIAHMAFSLTNRTLMLHF